MTDPTPKPTRKLARADWVRAAIAVMVDSSVEQVRVERLAAVLGATKGSFYWHFKDRGDLLGAVLEEWRERSTLAVQRRFAEADPRPEAQLLMFLQLPLRSDPASRAADLELAVLGWARRSDEVAQVVGEVDRMRARHMAGLFEQMGAAPAEAAMRAHMGYAGLRYVWLRRDLPLAERLDFSADLHARLTRDLPGLA